MSTRELSPEYLKYHYIDLRKNRYQISKETGVSPSRIGSLLQQYGIKRYSVERHGLCTHPLNIMWQGIKERCTNPAATNFKWYGGRGITLCNEWNNFCSFYDWAINHGWKEGLSIDRIDNSKGYSPDNCRFISHREQCRNRRSNVLITVDGVTHLQCEWEEILGLNKKRIAKWKHRHGEEYVINSNFPHN